MKEINIWVSFINERIKTGSNSLMDGFSETELNLNRFKFIVIVIVGNRTSGEISRYVMKILWPVTEEREEMK